VNIVKLESRNILVVPFFLRFCQSARPNMVKGGKLPHKAANQHSASHNQIQNTTNMASSVSAGLQKMNMNEEAKHEAVEVSPFPVKTKQAAGLVNGTETDISSFYFADKIMITISQDGRLSQWVLASISCPHHFTNFSPDSNPSLLRLANSL